MFVHLYSCVLLMFICFCMDFNCCLSLSHSTLLVQYCVSPYCFQYYLILLLVFTYLYSLFVFLLPSPIPQPPSSFEPHCPPLVPFCVFVFPFFSVTVFSWLPYLIPPFLQRPVLSLPNVHWLAEAAKPAGPAWLGAVSAAFEAGPRVRRSVPDCELFLSTGLCSHTRVPGWKLFL